MARQLFRRFLAGRDGVAAVEFALVAPIFFALLFSVLEAGWTMAKVMMLEGAVERTVRELRIGRAEGFSHDYVRDRICERAYIFSDCKAQMLVEMIPVALGAALPASKAVCVNQGGTSNPTVQFNPGKRSELVFLRACVATATWTPGLGLGLALSGAGDGSYYIAAKSTFLNEPS